MLSRRQFLERIGLGSVALGLLPILPKDKPQWQWEMEYDELKRGYEHHEPNGWLRVTLPSYSPTSYPVYDYPVYGKNLNDFCRQALDKHQVAIIIDIAITHPDDVELHRFERWLGREWGGWDWELVEAADRWRYYTMPEAYWVPSGKFYSTNDLRYSEDPMMHTPIGT